MTPSLFDSNLYRLHPASIATMAEFMLAFFILIYFLSLRGKTRDTWMMVIYIGLAMIVYLVDIGVTSSRPPLYGIFRVSHTVLASVWTLYWIWLAYNYRAHPWPREAISIIIGAACLLTVFFIGLLFPGHTITSYWSFMSIYNMHAGLQAWVIVVLLRRSAIMSRRLENSYGDEVEQSLALVGQSVTTLRAFALVTTCSIIMLIGTLTIAGTPFPYHIGQMILLLGVLMVHVSYANEITTLQVKLVALPLTTVLALLGLLPFLIFGVTSPESTWGSTNVELQKKLIAFAWLIPGSALFILAAFFLFYRVSLLRPLALLMKGVQYIEAGDLQTRVPVISKDEIGSFAQNLNKMASSLMTAQGELENKVLERTAELQTSLNQLKATQTQLIQREKMASLGELTAGIAHEIQNPLNFVNNFSEVSTELLVELKEELDRGDPDEAKAIADDLSQNLQKITQHGQRASSIVKGMLEHSRTSAGERQPTDINALADEYLRLAYQGFRAKDKDGSTGRFNATLKTDFATDLANVEVVAQEIGRVLLNLFNNAFYAVHQKQKLSPADYKPTVVVSVRQVDTQLEIRVSDNGTGIPESIKAKIFQPFFTTKPTGEGTGLGLSLSYDIITKGHSGTLTVDSVEGEGTKFVISIPA